MRKRSLLNPGSLRSRVFAAALLAAVLLLASGCGLSDKRNSGRSGIPEAYVGILGVDIGFAKESVPPVTTSGSRSDLLLLVANGGAVDASLSDDYMIVTLRDTAGAFAFGNSVLKGSEIAALLPEDSETRKQGKLAGKASNNAVGSVEAVTIEALAAGFEQSEDAIATGLVASVCYRYSTRLATNVCIDASPYTFQKQRKPCDAKAPIVLSKGQGAPVAIRKIETITERFGSAVRPKFKIYIANAGKGLVVNRERIDLFCTDAAHATGDSEAPTLNVVNVDLVDLNGRGLTCSKKGKPLILTGKSSDDFILCAYDTDFKEETGTFTTPLRVELSYGYTSTSATVPVRIEKGIATLGGSDAD